MNKYDDLGLGVPRGGGGTKPINWVREAVYEGKDLLKWDADCALTLNEGVTPLMLPAQEVNYSGLDNVISSPAYKSMYFHLKYDAVLKSVKFLIEYVSGYTAFRVYKAGNGEAPVGGSDMVYERNLTEDECANGFVADHLLKAGWYKLNSSCKYKHTDSVTKSLGNASFCDKLTYSSNGNSSTSSFGIGELEFQNPDKSSSYMMTKLKRYSDFVKYEGVLVEGTGSPTIQILNSSNEVVKSSNQLGKLDMRDIPMDEYWLKIYFGSNESLATITKVVFTTECSSIIKDKTYFTKLIASQDINKGRVCTVNNTGEVMKLPFRYGALNRLELERTIKDSNQSYLDRLHVEYLGDSKYLFYSYYYNEPTIIKLIEIRGEARELSRLEISTQNYWAHYHGMVKLDKDNILITYGRGDDAYMSKISFTNNVLELVWEELMSDIILDSISYRDLAINEDTGHVFMCGSVYSDGSNYAKFYKVNFNNDGTLKEFAFLTDKELTYRLHKLYWLKGNHFILWSTEEKSSSSSTYYSKFDHWVIDSESASFKNSASCYGNMSRRKDVYKHKGCLVHLTVNTSGKPYVVVYSINEVGGFIEKYHNGNVAPSSLSSVSSHRKLFGIIYMGDDKFMWGCPEFNDPWSYISKFPNNPSTTQMTYTGTKLYSPYIEIHNGTNTYMESLVVNSPDNGCLFISLNSIGTMENGFDKGLSSKMMGSTVNASYGISMEDKQEGELINLQIDGVFLAKDQDFVAGQAVFYNSFGELTQEFGVSSGLFGVAHTSNTIDILDKFDNLPSRMFAKSVVIVNRISSSYKVMLDVKGIGKFAYKGTYYSGSTVSNRPRIIYVDGLLYATDNGSLVLENVYFNKSVKIESGYISGNNYYAGFTVNLEVLN